MPFDAETRAKAAQGRRDAIAAAQHFKRNWLDSATWEKLAQTRGIRLPQWWSRPTPARLKRWHRTLDKVPFAIVYGASPTSLIALNPHVPLRAFVGQMLERASG